MESECDAVCALFWCSEVALSNEGRLASPAHTTSQATPHQSENLVIANQLSGGDSLPDSVSANEHGHNEVMCDREEEEKVQD